MMWTVGNLSRVPGVLATMDPTQDVPSRSPWRSALASFAAVIAALAFGWMHHAPPLVLWIPGGLLVVAAALVWRRGLPGDLLVRAVLWSNLVLGFLLALSGSAEERAQGGVIALATGAGLLILGRAGLDQPSAAFRPAAFRGSLVLALVMALADTQSLALFGGLHLENGQTAAGAPLLMCAGVMVIAILGLYRLQVWGLVLNIVANLLIAGLALCGALAIPSLLAASLATTAVIQLALPMPLVVALAGRDSPRPASDSRLAAALMTGVIVALMAIAAVGMVMGHAPIKL